MKTLTEIITEAIDNPENRNEDGTINWNFVDADVWMHEDGKNYSGAEKIDAVENYSCDLKLCAECFGAELHKSEMRCVDASDDQWICQECEVI